MINKIIHGCLKIWNFSSRAQLDISPVRHTHFWAFELHTRREIPYLRALMYYSLYPSIVSGMLLAPIKLLHYVFCMYFAPSDCCIRVLSRTNQIRYGGKHSLNLWVGRCLVLSCNGGRVCWIMRPNNGYEGHYRKRGTSAVYFCYQLFRHQCQYYKMCVWVYLR